MTTHKQSYSETRDKLKALILHLKSIQAVYETQKICTFRPNRRGEQGKFFSDQGSYIRLVMGDNRSGKTECGMVEAIAHSLGYRPWLSPDDPYYIVRLPGGRPIPVPNVGRIVLQNFKTAIRQNIWKKFLDYAPRGWYTYKKDNQGVPVEVNWKNGSEVFFMSDKQDDMDFEGTWGHWWWGDEPFGYNKYAALQRGLIDKGGHSWLTLTPLSQFWIQDMIEDRAGDPDGEVKKYRFKISDNEISAGGHMTKEAIQRYLADLREDQLGARMGGQWLHMTGRVYKEWEAKPPYWIEPIEIKDTWPRVCIIDPHPRKPVAVLWAAVNPDNQWYVYRELFDDRLVTIEEVANRMKELEGWEYDKKRDQWFRTLKTEHIVSRRIDSSSKEQERTSGSTVQTEFAAHGISCAVAPKRNAAVGYDAIHKALRFSKYEWDEPQLIVFNTCPTVKRNFLRFVWKEWESSRDRDLKGDRQEVLKHEDDFIDTIRYIFQSGFSYKGLSGALNEQEDDDLPLSGMSMLTGEMVYEGIPSDPTPFPE